MDVSNVSPTNVPGTTTREERVYHAGRGEPMPIRELPEAPPPVHLIGPTVFLVALGVGMGESYMWPRLVLIFGPEIRWLFLIGVTLQAVVMLEMARYAMATGESIFYGAARVFKPLMWFFFITAMAVYIWPGHMSAGAGALEEISGIPWQVSAICGLLFVGILFSLASVIYNLLEKMLAVLIGLLVVGSSIVAAMLGTLSDLSSTLTGMVAFGYMPDEAMTAAWFPVISERRDRRREAHLRHPVAELLGDGERVRAAARVTGHDEVLEAGGVGDGLGVGDPVEDRSRLPG